jgi:hypothetical protein
MTNPSKFAHVGNMATEELYMDADSGEKIFIFVG